MMQVSSLYAHSFERQLVARRSHILQNISRSYASVEPQHKDKQDAPNHAEKREERKTQQESPVSPADVQSLVNELFLTEAGILPPELRDEAQCSANQCSTLTHNNNNLTACAADAKQEIVDAKEFTDRLCKLPSQCKGGYILGSPRRHPGNMTSATRLCQSAGHLNLTSDYSLMKTQNNGKKAVSASENASKSSVSDSSDKKGLKKGKGGGGGGGGKEKKDAKKLPSNFMYLGTWSTRQNSEKLLEEVRSGDVLEFNIKFHHHWGIALVNKNKKPTLENLELIHLKKDKTGAQKAVKQTLAEYWIEGVTARINNSRDVHKQPLPAADVIATSLKVVTQPYRIWQNSEQLITHCRYGEGTRSRQMSDAARWGTLSKCVGLWLSLTSSRSSSPSTSPAVRRKRTLSVNF